MAVEDWKCCQTVPSHFTPSHSKNSPFLSFHLSLPHPAFSLSCICLSFASTCRPTSLSVFLLLLLSPCSSLCFFLRTRHCQWWQHCILGSEKKNLWGSYLGKTYWNSVKSLSEEISLNCAIPSKGKIRKKGVCFSLPVPFVSQRRFPRDELFPQLFLDHVRISSYHCHSLEMHKYMEQSWENWCTFLNIPHGIW